ncbi:MAG: glycosyltransferase [Bacteroidia bacterium]|jgi:glycosyltransferase involved in cell wall biosynthesis|nr:glycosyltransferase [Bacteroidia bacterium]
MDKKLNVLILPFNIASMPSITVKALKERGHNAVGLIIQNDIKQSADGLIVYNHTQTIISRVWTYLRWYLQFIRLLFWADVIHWCGGFSSGLLKACGPVIKLLKKPAVVEFLGSDIRNPEIEFINNPYYKQVFNQGYEYAYESKSNSISTQLDFKKYGFKSIALPGMKQYIDNTIFSHTYELMQRIDCTAFDVKIPVRDLTKPLIVHSPSAPICKGTQHVLAAIERLKNEFAFEFILIQNMPHQEAKRHIQSCDLFIDQLIIGSYGMATMEALASGKPVICYLKPSVTKYELPLDCPIINANPDTLETVLRQLLINTKQLSVVGNESRNYALKYHDINQALPQLIEVYNKAIATKNN